MLAKTYILGVGITTSARDKILETIESFLSQSKENEGKLVIFTPNPEQISSANTNYSFKDLLNEADIALPDGVGVVVGARLLGKPIYKRISGVDLVEEIHKSIHGGEISISKKPIKTGYLGGERGVAEEAAKCLQKKYPEISIGYVSDVYDKVKMMHSDIDILFVALGFPKQEEWIMEHKDEVPARIIMGVGGSFDFFSGRIPRAPIFLQTIGLEWLFRLMRQPWRIFRQLRLLHFSALVLLEALSSRLKRLTNNDKRIVN